VARLVASPVGCGDVGVDLLQGCGRRVESGDQALFGFGGRCDAGLQLSEPAFAVCEIGVERTDTRRQALFFSGPALHRAAECPEFAPDLGGSTRGVVAPASWALGGERSLIALEFGFGRGELIGLGLELGGLAGEVVDLALDASVLGLECGDHIVCEERSAIALHGADPLVDQGDETAAALTQRLDTRQGVETRVARCGQLMLKRGDRDVELSDRCSQVGLLVCEIRPRHGGGRGRFLEGLQLTSREVEAKLAEFGDDVAVASRSLGLLLERSKLTTDLAL